MPVDAHEEDYCRVVDPGGTTRFLPGTGIEIVAEIARPFRPQHVLFDFDGTLSLIREGWPEVMGAMMIEILQSAGTGESAADLARGTHHFIMELAGKQTIYQMIRLADEVVRRGGKPEDPAAYKRVYDKRLMARIADRRAALRSGRRSPDEMLVPGARELLDALSVRGVTMYIASGTDEQYVQEETRLLGLDRYFGDRIYGALEDYRQFSKALIIDRILSENRLPGDALLGFGDGYVETSNVKQAGGVAVAVASDESGRSGRPDPWKRERLIGVGADVVVPDYRESGALLAYLFGEPGAEEA